MNDAGKLFPLSDEQFDKLMHYVDVRVTVALERPTPARAAMSEQFVADLKEGFGARYWGQRMSDGSPTTNAFPERRLISAPAVPAGSRSNPSVA